MITAMPEKDIIYIEDVDIYDGWCAQYNVKNKTVTWRDAWFTNRLSEEFKRKKEQIYLKSFGNEDL